ncbi:MAG TPA: ABC transporter permease [Devosia sp.]|jgi:NitT/TauT family transport system permease protein|uniref:ABC transporter permease n=1 Tax=Devosia sp. TaxID=1871048 RepID=UPI002F93BE7F
MRRTAAPLRESATIWLFRAVLVVLLILAWWGAALLVGRNLVPTPLATWQAATTLFAQPAIYQATANSLGVYLGGMLIAIAIGLPAGLVAGGVPLVGKVLDPFFNALMATPRVAFIPLIIVLLGLGYEAKIAVVALGAVMPILVNTYAGVRNGDPELVEMAHSAGATKLQVFTKILLPGAAPFIVVGLRLGATIGLINTVVAELYTAVQGLGGLLATYGNTFRMAPYFVVVLILALLGVLITEALRLLERRLERWRQH